MPALGISMILIAIGAILAFAVTASVEGLAITSVGVILMAVGFGGVLMSLMFLMSFSPWGTHETHVHDVGPHDQVHR